MTDLAVVHSAELLAAEVVVDRLFLDPVQKHVHGIDIAESLTGGSIERTIEGASTVSFIVSDAKRAILNSELLETDPVHERLRTIDVQIDGLDFRLAAVNKSGDDLTFTFEDREVAWLREHNSPLAVSRAHTTRAEFILRMVREVRAGRIKFISPELHVRQPIEKAAKKDSQAFRDKHKKPGLAPKASDPSPNTPRGSAPLRAVPRTNQVPGSRVPGQGGAPVGRSSRVSPDVGVQGDQRDLSFLIGSGDFASSPHALTKDAPNKKVAKNITVKGRPATDHQRKLIDEVLAAGDQKNASQKVLICSMMTIIQESGVDEKAKNGDHVGLFQQSRAAGWPATGDASQDADAFFDAAIKVDHANPDISYEGLCEHVQHSGQGSLYAQWRDEATKIVKEFGGGSSTNVYFKRYEFTRGVDGKPEDSWTCMQRLATEVGWRCFMVNGTLYYMSEDDLMRQRAIARFSEDSDGILGIDWDWDHGKPVKEATVTCRIDRWNLPPGGVVVIDDQGPASGRWLILSITRDIFSPAATMSLKRPSKPKPEPRSELATTQTRGGSAGGGGGTVSYAPGANRPGVPMRQPIKDFLELLAGMTTETITVNTGTAHDQFSTTGGQSDHWTGDAGDLNVGGDARSNPAASRKGDNIAAAALRLCGIDQSTARSMATSGRLDFSTNFSWRGHRVQIGWKTLAGGNHYNHVHVGVAP